MAAGLLFLLAVRLAYARRPSVTTHNKSKWLIKWMRTSAVTVENAFQALLVGKIRLLTGKNLTLAE
ncbi:MAG: hypothetical protein LBF67_08725 [Prevotellaceae bacterium]|jgi:hypothetical protein|nr:hypothetical protein [Prevotellaceae bacterium]